MKACSEKSQAGFRRVENAHQEQVQLVRIVYKVSELHTESNHHVVSAMVLSHRTYPSFISAMSSTLGLSPKCVQRVMIWFRSHVAASHIQFLLSGYPHRCFAAGVAACPERTRLDVRHARHDSV